jgi:putative membrane protein
MKIVHAMFIALGLCCTAGAGAQEPMKPSTAIKLLIDDDEQEFFKAAASSGMFEIEAAKLALERSQNDKIKQFAQKMIADHGKADAELKQLAQQKGVTLPTELMSRHQMMLDELRDEGTPEEFDEAYRRAMLASHKEAVSMFDEMKDDADDPEVKAFAARTLPKLQQHGGHAKALPGSS